MCDEHTEESNETFLKGEAWTNVLNRRTAVALGSAAALAACTTTAEPEGGAVSLTERDVEITTADGACDAYFVAPSRGKHAAVLVWPDIMGLRPAFRTMGKRLAQQGYAVLTVNPFYRRQKGVVYDAATESFSTPAVRNRLVPLMQSLNADTNRVDAIAFTGWLDQQREVDTRKGIGTTGYCMGGPLVMRTAAYVPNRIKAAGTFHGGGMATTQPNSPHLLVPQMKAKFLHCVAQNDDTQDPQMKERLRAAFAAANLPAEIEVYPAQHGWCSIDSAVFDQVQADRAYGRLINLFSTALA
jgi:carboxymethylenebutenolidase